jgi:hypothetical protein
MLCHTRHAFLIAAISVQSAPTRAPNFFQDNATNSRGNINQQQIRSRDNSMDRLLRYTTVIKWTFGKSLGQCFSVYSRRVLVSEAKERDGKIKTYQVSKCKATVPAAI